MISRYRKGERLPASDSEYLKKLADGIVKTAIEKGRPDWESESVLQKLKETLAGEEMCIRDSLIPVLPDVRMEEAAVPSDRQT